MASGRSRMALGRLAVVAALFVAWEVLSRSHLVDPRLLPPASEVLATLGSLLWAPQIYWDIGVTLTETLLAFAIAVPIGALIGLVVAENRYLGEVFKPLLFFVFSIPKSVFLPMFILIFGISFSQKVAFGFLSCCLTVAIAAAAAVESIRQDHVTVARSFGATRSQMVMRVYLPSVLPILLEGVRIGMIFNFTGVILAEMYASQAGLGSLIANWGETFAMRPLLAGVLLVSALAIAFNMALRWMEGRWRHWQA